MKPKTVLTKDQWDAKRTEWLNTGMKIGVQQMCDFMAIALNDQDVMGSRAMSGDAINKVLDRAIELIREYWEAFYPSGNAEADVKQEQIDHAMRRIFKEKAQPFYERYPYIKKCKY